MGQKAIFEAGFQVGACSLGYRPVEVPGAGVTKKGKPKTRPEIVPEVAALIVKHYELIAGGMTLSEGCRLWNREISTWPAELRELSMDPRTQTGQMRPEAYRRIFTRKKYIGLWEHGRKRNKWMNSKDGTVQVDAPANEVAITMREDLRIVSNELFYRVQHKLSEGKRGKHGLRTGKEPSLADSLVNLYHCSECGHVFHYYGQEYMHCPESTKGICNNRGTVNRKGALEVVIDTLRNRVLANKDLIAKILEKSLDLDTEKIGEELTGQISALEKSIRLQDDIMSVILDEGTRNVMDAEDKMRYKKAGVEKARLRAELASLKARNNRERKPISEEVVMMALAEFNTLLSNAGLGNLGADEKHLVAGLIRDLVSGKIMVSFTRLRGRRAFGVGTFTPNPNLALSRRHDVDAAVAWDFPVISMEFRKHPRQVRIADETYRLYTEEGLSFTEIGKRFECGSGNAWLAYAYWHTSRGLPIPYQSARVKAKHEKIA